MRKDRNTSVIPATTCVVCITGLAALGIGCAVASLSPGPAAALSGAVLLLAGGAVALLLRRLYQPLRALYRFIDALKSGNAERRSLEEAVPADDDEPAVLELCQVLMEEQEQREHGHEVEMLHSRAEFDALQSQINPHFLYNTLESIRGQALEEGNREIANMTKKLSAIFRYSIGQSEALVRLRDELDNVQSYMAIQQYRFEDKFDFAIQCDDPVEVQDLLLPKLTIQPLVENAIFHGLEPKIGACRITIRITRTQQRLSIEVRDNGVGIPDEQLEALNRRIEGVGGGEERSSQKHAGIALHNVNKRIRLSFGGDYGLRLHSTPGLGTEAHINLPLVSERPAS